MRTIRKITSGEIDPDFEKEVEKMPEAEKITSCFQCGVCSGSCPIVFAMDYTPRQIAEMIHLGLKNEVLQSSTIWLCSTCYMCYERCPQGVKLTEVLNAIKNLAVKEGHRVPPVYEKMVSSLLKTGRIYDVSDFINEDREFMGLPRLERPDVEAIAGELKDTLICRSHGEDKE